MKFSKTLLASAVLLASSQAFAAIDHPQSDSLNTGGSELVLGVYDKTTQTTYLLDTEVKFNDIALMSDGTTFDFSAALANLTGDFEWQVFAADNVNDDANAQIASIPELGRRVAITTSAPTHQYTNGAGSEGLQVNQNLAGFMELAIDGGSIGGWSGEYGYIIEGKGSINGYGTQEFALMQDVYASKQLGRVTRVVADHSETTHLGSFEFLADNSLVFSALNSNPPSEVPLPAAAWLLLSGLAGLGGVARRRRRS